MADKHHHAILKQGVDVWNKWRKEHPDTMIDLQNVDFRYADLRGANLLQADLTKAKLNQANLSEAVLSLSNLSEANLTSVDLSGASLFQADLRGANLKKVILYHANLYESNLSGANLSGADLYGANLSKANLSRTNLVGCRVYAIAAWDIKLENTIQSGLIITPYNEPTITVDNLEVAQFIYLLLNHKKLRDVFNSVTEKGVLLLGRFSDGGLDLLQAIAGKLREMKYLPMIFDFDRPNSRDYTETVKTLVGLSRFVIIDLSGPSVPQELYSTIPHFKIPFVPIIEKGRKIYSMFVDLAEYPWVLKPVVEFKNKEHLMKLLPLKVIEPAEEKFKERQALLNQLFNR